MQWKGLKMEIKGILFYKDGPLLIFEKTWRPIAIKVINQIMTHYHLPTSSRKPSIRKYRVIARYDSYG